MKAWIDPEWFEGDGIMVVYAADSEEARRQLDMDCDGEPEELPAAEDFDALGADADPLLLMLGVFGLMECHRCSNVIRHEVDRTFEGDELNRSRLYSWGQDGDEQEPVRVAGVGLFCSRACWRSSPWGPIDVLAQHDAIWADLREALEAGGVPAVNACGRRLRALYPRLDDERNALLALPEGELRRPETIARYDALTDALRTHWGTS